MAAGVQNFWSAEYLPYLLPIFQSGLSPYLSETLNLTASFSYLCKKNYLSLLKGLPQEKGLVWVVCVRSKILVGGLFGW